MICGTDFEYPAKLANSNEEVNSFYLSGSDYMIYRCGWIIWAGHWSGTLPAASTIESHLMINYKRKSIRYVHMSNQLSIPTTLYREL